MKLKSLLPFGAALACIAMIRSGYKSNQGIAALFPYSKYPQWSLTKPADQSFALAITYLKGLGINPGLEPHSFDPNLLIFKAPKSSAERAASMVPGGKLSGEDYYD